MTALWISAGIDLQEGADLAETRAALSELAALTEAEPGCLKFEVLENIENAGRFILWEQWRDASDLAAHFDMPHTKAYLARNLTTLAYIEKLTHRTAASSPSSP